MIFSKRKMENARIKTRENREKEKEKALRMIRISKRVTIKENMK